MLANVGEFSSILEKFMTIEVKFRGEVSQKRTFPFQYSEKMTVGELKSRILDNQYKWRKSRLEISNPGLIFDSFPPIRLSKLSFEKYDPTNSKIISFSNPENSTTVASMNCSILGVYLQVPDAWKLRPKSQPFKQKNTLVDSIGKMCQNLKDEPADTTTKKIKFTNDIFCEVMPHILSDLETNEKNAKNVDVVTVFALFKKMDQEIKELLQKILIQTQREHPVKLEF